MMLAEVGMRRLCCKQMFIVLCEKDKDINKT